MIVPVSGGSGDQRLLEVVSKISNKQSVAITIVFVVEVEQSMPLDAELPAEIERGERVLKSARIFADTCVHGRQGSVQTELLQARSAGAAIVDEAIDRDADVIMLAASLRRKHGRITTGETIDYVMTHAPCEVVVIRLAQPEWQAEMMGMS
ncbi:MAG: universal stress protein [Thermomicrobiales bacterium]